VIGVKVYNAIAFTQHLLTNFILVAFASKSGFTQKTLHAILGTNNVMQQIVDLLVILLGHVLHNKLVSKL